MIMVDSKQIHKLSALLNIKVLHYILSKKASQLTQKTIINQVHGANNDPVCKSGQKLTGALRACVGVIS